MNSRLPLGATAILAVAAISAVPALAQAPVAPVSGTLVRDGSWDGAAQQRRGGLPADWAGIQVRPRGRQVCFAISCARHAFKLVTVGTREGKAARFEVRDGDNPFGDAERAEVQMLPEAGQGAQRWYVWSMLMTPEFRANGATDGRYLALTQWPNEKGGSPPVGFYVNRNILTLQMNLQKSTKQFTAAARPWGVPLDGLRNRWVDFAMLVRWSANNDGYVDLYVDGVQQTMNWPFGAEGNNPAALGGIGGTRFTGRTMVPRAGKIQIKQGIARAKQLQGKTVIFHDAMRAYDALRPAAVAPLPPVAAPTP